MKNKIVPVYIEFLDHASNSSWMDNTELVEFKPTLVYQLGWLVEEDATAFKIAGQVTDDGSAGDTICILKSTVKHFKKLRCKL